MTKLIISNPNWVFLLFLCFLILELVVIFIFSALCLLIKNKFIKADPTKSDSLSKRAIAERRRISRLQEQGTLLKYLNAIVLPTKTSISIVVGIGFAFWWLSNLWSNEGLKTDSENLFAVHAGVTGIVFALLIFIATEGKNSDVTKDRLRIYLRESFAFPLTVAAIVVFFLVAWGAPSYTVRLAVFLIGALTVVSLYKLMRLMLDKVDFSKKRKKFYSRLIRKNIELALAERIGNNLFISLLENEKAQFKAITYSSYYEETDDYFYVKARKFGQVIDINLSALKKLDNKIRNLAEKKGFGFKVDDDIFSPESRFGGLSEIDKVSFVKKRKRELIDRQELLKKYYDKVSDDQDVLFAVSRKLLDNESVENAITALVLQIYEIGKLEDFSDEMFLELEGLKDNFASSIKEGRLGKIEEERSIYLLLVETFLDCIGSSYGREQAESEIRALGGRWGEIKWLTDSVSELCELAVTTNDINVIRRVTSMPYAFMTRAIYASDQYLFQEFLVFQIYIYNWSLQEMAKERTRNFLKGRSWIYLRELLDFVILGALRRSAKSVEDVKAYVEFTIPVLKTYQNLLKKMIEIRDVAIFEEVLESIASSFRFLTTRESFSELRSIEYSLSHSDSESEKQELEGKLAFYKAKDEAANQLLSKRHEPIFGLAAWTLNRLVATSDDHFQRCLNVLVSQLPTDVYSITNLFLRCRSFEGTNEWGWDSWEMTARRVVHRIDFNSKLDVLYIRLMLIQLGIRKRQEIELRKMPISRDFSLIIDNLLAVLADLESSPHRLKIDVEEQDVLRFDELKKLLVGVKKRHAEEEANRLRNAVISNVKVAEFRTSFVDGYYENCSVRKIINAFGAVTLQKKKDMDSMDSNFGLNELSDKGPFLEDWHVSYSDWGSSYGRGLANAENYFLIETISQNISKKITVNEDSFRNDVKNAIDSLEAPILIHNVGRVTGRQYLSEIESYKSRYLSEFSSEGLDPTLESLESFEGRIDHKGKVIPVFAYAKNEESEDEFLFVDLKNLGRLRQIEVENANVKIDEIRSQFSLDIISLSERDEERLKLLAAKPEWLIEEPEPDSYLKEKVVIKIFEKFDWELLNSKAGISLMVGGKVG